MSTQDYIVMQLVAPAPRTQRGFTFGTLDAATVPPQATVSVEALTPGDVARARRAPGVMVAPPMPIKLVAPLAVAEPVDAGTAAANETWGVAAVGAPGSTVTGAGVKVAVLDTGIDAAHPAFANLTVTERDFTGAGDGDTHGHGTHCAGTIAGADVGGLRIGIARGLGELLIGKVLGDQGGSTASIVEAMNWAGEQGANVISMSLGIDFAGAVNDLVQQQGLPIQAATSWALQAYRDNVRVFESAASLLTTSAQLDNRAIVVVAASGNESQRPQYTIDVSPPAASTGFVKVAAVGQGAGGALQIAPFSNTGVDVAGPGVNVISAKPGGGTQAMSGTSMATPHAAGVAALWAEKLGVQATSGMLRAHLEGQAQAIQGLGASDVGSGLVHAPS